MCCRVSINCTEMLFRLPLHFFVNFPILSASINSFYIAKFPWECVRHFEFVQCYWCGLQWKEDYYLRICVCVRVLALTHFISAIISMFIRTRATRCAHVVFVVAVVHRLAGEEFVNEWGLKWRLMLFTCYRKYFNVHNGLLSALSS